MNLLQKINFLFKCGTNKLLKVNLKALIVTILTQLNNPETAGNTTFQF